MDRSANFPFPFPLSLLPSLPFYLSPFFQKESFLYYLWYIFFILYYFQIEKRKNPTYLFKCDKMSINVHPCILWVLLLYSFLIFPDVLYANKTWSNAAECLQCIIIGTIVTIEAGVDAKQPHQRWQLSKLCHCKQHHLLSLKKECKP